MMNPPDWYAVEERLVETGLAAISRFADDELIILRSIHWDNLE